MRETHLVLVTTHHRSQLLQSWVPATHDKTQIFMIQRIIKEVCDPCRKFIKVLTLGSPFLNVKYVFQPFTQSATRLVAFQHTMDYGVAETVKKPASAIQPISSW